MLVVQIFHRPGVSSAPDPATKREISEAVQKEREENRRRYAARAGEWKEVASAGETVKFPRDMGATEAVKLKEYSENNLFVSTQTQMSRDEIQVLNRRVNEAKKQMGITEDCHIPFVVVADDEFAATGTIASYHPVTDAVFISKKLLDDEKRLEAQAECA